MTAPVSSVPHAATREALLEAAAEVFSEVGFRAATVREICQRARANIAAINYHFGDKEALYLAVLRYTQDQAYKEFPIDLGVGPSASAEEKLRAFIRSFLLRIFSENLHHGKIMSREMIEPTKALNELVQEKVRPQAVQLVAIIGDLVGSNASEEQIRFCCFSIVSQCAFYHHCRPVISRLFPEQKFAAEEIEKIAEHIFQFSLAALKNHCNEKSAAPTKVKSKRSGRA